MFHISEVIKDIENQQKRVLAILEEHCLNGGSWRVAGPNQVNRRRWAVYVDWTTSMTRQVASGPTMLDALSQAAQLVENAKRIQSFSESNQEATDSNND